MTPTTNEAGTSQNAASACSLPEPHASTFQRILNEIAGRYKKCIMNNVYRSNYVEGLVAITLGEDWELTATTWDWASWDCEHTSGVRLEVKQAAKRQSWDEGESTPPRAPRFDIAPRTGYWSREGNQWVAEPGRPAHIYVFAWHGKDDKHANHRDPRQWHFFVVKKEDLPDAQKSIGLAGLEKIASPCSIEELKRAVENFMPGESGKDNHSPTASA